MKSDQDIADELEQKAHAQALIAYDIDGNRLMVGNEVTTIAYGKCRVEEILDVYPHHFGPLLKIKDSHGHHIAVRVKLSQVKLVPHIDPKEKITTQKYGV